MKWKAIVTDLDGTLLTNDKRISERNMQALEACHALGMRIVIATARPPRTVNEMLPAALLDIAALICYNGAQVACRATNTSVHETIPQPLTREMVEHVLASDPEAEITMEADGEWLSLRAFELSDNLSFRSLPAVVSREIFAGKSATKLMLTRYDRVEALKREYGSQVHIVVTDHGELVQIMPRDASKERAAASLCARYGISPEEVIVFGDDYNDLGLFETFSYAVAMGNAVQELKEAAAEVTVSNEADGVAVVLERLLAALTKS